MTRKTVEVPVANSATGTQQAEASAICEQRPSLASKGRESRQPEPLCVENSMTSGLTRPGALGLGITLDAQHIIQNCSDLQKSATLPSLASILADAPSPMAAQAMQVDPAGPGAMMGFGGVRASRTLRSAAHAAVHHSPPQQRPGDKVSAAAEASTWRSGLSSGEGWLPQESSSIVRAHASSNRPLSLPGRGGSWIGLKRPHIPFTGSTTSLGGGGGLQRTFAKATDLRTSGARETTTSTSEFLPVSKPGLAPGRVIKSQQHPSWYIPVQ